MKRSWNVDDVTGLLAVFENSPKYFLPEEQLDAYEKRYEEERANRPPSAAELFVGVKRDTIAKWRRHETDVGSSEVQVAIADERVKYLTRHLLNNKHDNSAKRGLQALVVARRKFLDDIYRRDPDKAMTMAAELGVRFKPSGQVWDKIAKYSAFKNTKHKYIKTADGRKKRVKD